MSAQAAGLPMEHSLAAARALSSFVLAQFLLAVRGCCGWEALSVEVLSYQCLLSISLFICSRGTVGDDGKEAAAALSFCRNTHWSSLGGKWLICNRKHFSAELPGGVINYLFVLTLVWHLKKPQHLWAFVSFCPVVTQQPGAACSSSRVQ